MPAGGMLVAGRCGPWWGKEAGCPVPSALLPQGKCALSSTGAGGCGGGRGGGAREPGRPCCPIGLMARAAAGGSGL